MEKRRWLSESKRKQKREAVGESDENIKEKEKREGRTLRKEGKERVYGKCGEEGG